MSVRHELPDQRVQRLNEAWHDASASAILQAALSEFSGDICYVSSFGAESAVLLSLLSETDRDLPILFINTGMHFRQTLSYRRRLVQQLSLSNVQDITPSKPDLARLDPQNDLWKRSPDACCTLRKVEPLERALSGFGAWITGRKRFHGGARSGLEIFEYSNDRFKINPLAGWSVDDVREFFRQRDLPEHPLVEGGYGSVGCWPCTVPAKDSKDTRSGRWLGSAKRECGLHMQRKERQRIL